MEGDLGGEENPATSQAALIENSLIPWGLMSLETDLHELSPSLCPAQRGVVGNRHIWGLLHLSVIFEALS